MTAEKKEAFPLSWPTDWPRTRPQDRRAMAAWRRTATQYRDALATELERIQSPLSVISTNVPLSMRGAMTSGVEPLDVGVAVYFSRKIKEDFAWQDALGIHDPAPTEQQIQEAFRRLAQQYHPDRGGDVAMFQAVTKLTMKMTTRPFRTIGRPISHSVRQWPAPSIFAASIISCGTSWNIERMMRTLIASCRVM